MLTSKTKIALSFALLLFSNIVTSQVFTNGEVDGPVGSPSVPPSWADVPDTDPASLALAAIQATSDVLDGTGPNVGGGIAGNPFSGTTMVSGLQADGGAFYWHEGIQQSVNGFTPGNSYTICFYQSVVKQQNCADTSGSWRVYADNTLIGTSAISTSLLVFNDVNLVWDLRSVTFTATAATHLIKFLPWDDDANQTNTVGVVDGALRMGIDLISFGPPPGDPTITAAGPFCIGDPSLNLSAVDPGGTWTGTGITNGATGTFDPATAGVGVHAITYELASGCGGTITDNINITVTAGGNAAWTLPGTLCSNSAAINLNPLITGDPGGTWSGTGVTGNMFDPAGLSGAISVTYTVGAAPCIAMLSQDITVVNATGGATINPAGPFCAGDPAVILTAATGGGSWSGTGITNPATGEFDPSVSGVGTFMITYDVGSAPCAQSDNINITVTNASNASWTAPVTPLCANDAPIDLNALITGDAGGTWSGNGVTGSTFDPNGQSGVVSITYTVGSGTCQAVSTQNIGVVAITAVTSSTDITCNGADDGTANVVPGGGLAYTYSWNSNPNQTTQTANNLPAGTYIVTVTETNSGCTTTATVTIIEPGAMTVTGVTSPACGDLGIAEAVVNGGTGPFTYVWSPSGGTEAIADSLVAGMYTCDVTDVNGCTGSTIVNVITFPFPNVTVTADTTIKYGELIRLNAYGATNYSWSPPINLTCSDCEDPIATLSETTTYCVSGNNGGCLDSACVTITIEIDCGDVFVPSAFSPNSDGENDLVCAYGNCLESFVFVIYNRWGEKVFESSDKNICWDGTWKGKELNSAVFVYILEGTLITNEKVSLKGNISLIR